MKTYGTIELRKGNWYLTPVAHVMMRAKRCFGKLGKRSHGHAMLADTPENARDLEWFLSRYPMVWKSAEQRAWLVARAKEHREAEQTFEDLLSGARDTRVFNTALPLRDYQKAGAECALSMRSLLIADDLGLGKQQPVDTNVLTPQGYRQIGSVAIGDEVIGSDGAPTRVTGVFPQGVKPSYRVRLSDGSCVEAGPEHLWSVEYYIGGRRLHRIVVTTEQIRIGATVITQWPNGVTGRLHLGRTRLYIPMLSAPARFESSAGLPLQPYLLGQLIANGSLANSHGVALTTHVDDWSEIEDRLRSEAVAIGAVHVYGKANRAAIVGVCESVRALGIDVLSPEKRIPEPYLFASVDTRVALLQGLMDGDGSCSKARNRITYSTTSAGLADDVRHLVEHLGGTATVTGYDRSREGKPLEFHVRIRTPDGIEPFSVSRKARRLSRDRRRPCRRIVGVEHVRNVESVCIRVAAEDRLYATERAILTHNTAEAIAVLCDPRTRPALVVTLAHLTRQWASEIAKFNPSLRTHILRKGTPYDLRIPVHRRVNGQQLPLINDGQPDVLISTYHKLSGWADVLAGKVRSVVFDEVQELRHGEDSGKGKAAYAIAKGADFRVALSATPIYNYGGEFHNVFEAVRPGALGSWGEFSEEWCGARVSKSSRPKIKDPKAFGSYLRDQCLMIRRTRVEVGRELPSLQNVAHYIDCDADTIQRIESKATELARVILATHGDNERGAKMRASEELSNLARQATGIAKAPYVAEFVRMLLEQGEPVVLYGWHRECYAIWNSRLAAYHPVMYTGTESGVQKDRAKEAFLRQETNLLVMSLRSGAGLDGLQQRCRTVVFGELDWSPAVHDQCSGRVHRDGQKDPVVAYYLIAEDGSDPVVADVLGVKRGQIEGVTDPTKELVERLDVGADHVRKLAERYLRRSAA